MKPFAFAPCIALTLIAFSGTTVQRTVDAHTRPTQDSRTLKSAAVDLAIEGSRALDDGDPQAARAALEESLRLLRQMDHPQCLIVVLYHLGRTAEAQGDEGAARAYHQESLLWARRVGNQRCVDRALDELRRLSPQLRTASVEKRAFSKSMPFPIEAADHDAWAEAPVVLLDEEAW